MIKNDTKMNLRNFGGNPFQGPSLSMTKYGPWAKMYLWAYKTISMDISGMFLQSKIFATAVSHIPEIFSPLGQM